MGSGKAEEVEASGLRQVEDDGDADIEDHQHARDQNHLGVEDLPLDNSPALAEVEHFTKHGANGPEQPGGKPDKGGKADETDRLPALDRKRDDLFRQVAAGGFCGALPQNRDHHVEVTA